MAMARRQATLNRRKRERGSNGLVAKLNSHVSVGKRGQYKLGYSLLRENMSRERQAKRKAELHALWGNHADAVLAKCAAKERSKHLVGLVQSADARFQLDARRRHQQEAGNVLLGWHMRADSHVTYARFILTEVEGEADDMQWPIVKAYHRKPSLGVATSKRSTNGRDVWSDWRVC